MVPDTKFATQLLGLIPIESSTIQDYIVRMDADGLRQFARELSESKEGGFIEGAFFVCARGSRPLR